MCIYIQLQPTSCIQPDTRLFSYMRLTYQDRSSQYTNIVIYVWNRNTVNGKCSHQQNVAYSHNIVQA